MPTQRGYTGQLLDPSGLQYYHARYYDGSIGQFISADTVQGPNRYAYVGGNPETLTDSSGHELACQNPDVACHLGLRLSGNNPSTTADVSGCLGKAHCVIFIDGPNVSIHKQEDSVGTQITNWEQWKTFYETEYGGNVGFIYFEAPDTPTGAGRIQSALQQLNYSGSFNGTVSLVGHSNGAASIALYFDKEQEGKINHTYYVSNSPYAQSIAQEVLRDRSSDKLDCRALR